MSSLFSLASMVHPGSSPRPLLSFLLEESCNSGLIQWSCFLEVYKGAAEHCWGGGETVTLTVEACFPIDGTSAGVRVLASKHQPLVHMTPIKLSLVLGPPMLPPAPLLSEDAATSCSAGTRGSLARDRQFYKASSVCLQPLSFHSFQSPHLFLTPCFHTL